MPRATVPRSGEQTTDDLLAGVQPAASRRLLRAALDSFSSRGYHATTTRDISVGSGMSPAALYVHYPSKEALLFQLSHIAHESALKVVLDAIASAADPVGGVHAVALEFTAWHARHQTLARVAQYELAGLSPEHYEIVAALRRQLEQAVRAEIQRGAKAGMFTVPDVRAATLALLSMGIDVARWFNPDGRVRPQSLATGYAALALRMLGAK